MTDTTTENSEPGQPLGLAAERTVRPGPVAWRLDYFDIVIRERFSTFHDRPLSAMTEQPDIPSQGSVWEREEPLYDQAALDAAVAAERERCAKLCEPRPPLVNSDREWILLNELAERIRAVA